MKTGGALSIWFFTGLCLGVNGLLIFITGIYGALYAIRFSPARERKRISENS